MKTFILLFFLNYFLLDISNSLRISSKTDGADPLSKMSDAELDKMLKDMGMTSKDILEIGTGKI